MTDRAILVTPVAWQPAGARPLETTLSTSQVESATCMNSEGGSSARDQGKLRHGARRGWAASGPCRGAHAGSGTAVPREGSWHRDGIGPGRGGGGAGFGAQRSPIHQRNEPVGTQPLQADGFGHRDKRGRGCDLPQAPDASLLSRRVQGGVGVHHTPKAALPGSPPAPRSPQPSTGDARGGHGAVGGVHGAVGGTRVLPGSPFPTPRQSWEGIGWGGRPRGLQPLPCPAEAGGQHPWVPALPRHPAWLINQTHHSSGGGEVIPGRGLAPTEGVPAVGRGPHPAPDPRLGERGWIRGPRRVFPGPDPAQEEAARPRLWPRAERWGRRGDAGGRGDLSQRSLL